MRNIIFCLMLVSVVGCAGPVPWEPVVPPVAAPDFSLSTLSGQPVRLSEYQGRIVVMEFWATWCPTCRQTLPSLELIFRKYRDRGVQMLLMNLAEDAGRVNAFAKDRFQSTIILDTEKTAARLYGVTGIPVLFVIDRQGKIRYAKRGYGGGLERDLSGILDGLLAETGNGPVAD